MSWPPDGHSLRASATAAEKTEEAMTERGRLGPAKDAPSAQLAKRKEEAGKGSG